MDSKEENKNSTQSSRRRFLKQGAALAGLVAVGGNQAARAQGGAERSTFVPESAVPMDHVWRDPWDGTPLRDGEGNLVVDWTGTPQWETARKNVRAMGGPLYGTLEKDWRLYGYRTRWVTSFRHGDDGGGPVEPTTVKTGFFSLLSPLQDQTGIVTPSGLHFLDEHGEVPEVDPRKHRFTIFGMVDRPVTFTMEELMDMPSVSRFHTVECNSNGTTGHKNRLKPWATPGDVYGELSCSEWTGVPLKTLMEMVGVKKGASWFWAQSAEEFNSSTSLPLWKAMDDALLVYGQNGEPLRGEQGFPLRLLVPGFQGNNNIKRFSKIKITDEPGPFHRESRTYSRIMPGNKISWFRFEMQPKSCILRPSGGQQLTRHGFYEIKGIAWSGLGKVSRVEVTTDGGKTWKDAQIQEPVFSKAITRFVFPWSWNGEEVMIASRCTDERGTNQPTTAEWGRVYGIDDATTKSGMSFVRFNVIQPWKIDRDGRVTNAIFAI